MEALGKNIKYLRKQYGFTQDKLGEMIGGVKKSNVSNWEKGLNNPNLDAMILLSRIFKLSLDDLIKLDLEKTGFTLGFTSTGNYPLETDNLVQVNEPFHEIQPISRKNNILVPVAAHAGYAAGWGQERLPEEIQYIHVPGITQEARTFEVAGDSMNPVLYNGDYVVSTRIERPQEIKKDTIYIIVSSQSGIYIKYAEPQENGLLLSPANEPLYKSELLPSEEVKEIWEARLRITSSFLPSLSAKEANKLNTRIQKIEHFISQKHPDFPRSDE